MIAGIVTKNGTIYRVKTRQGIAVMFLEREENQEAGEQTDSPKERQLN